MRRPRIVCRIHVREQQAEKPEEISQVGDRLKGLLLNHRPLDPKGAVHQGFRLGLKTRVDGGNV